MTETGSLFAGPPERSKRRRTRLRTLCNRVAAPLIDWVASALWRTCRVSEAPGDEAWKAAMASISASASNSPPLMPQTC